MPARAWEPGIRLVGFDRFTAQADRAEVRIWAREDRSHAWLERTVAVERVGDRWVMRLPIPPGWKRSPVPEAIVPFSGASGPGLSSKEPSVADTVREEPLTEASFRSSAASRLTTSPTAVPQRPVGHGDFAASLRRHTRSAAPRWGWRGRVHRLSEGRLSPAPCAAEQEWNNALRAVQMSFAGPRTIVFVNPKGGASKTTATLMAGRTFGVHRGGGVVAIDNNETRGTLGERSLPAGHANTARELLDQLHTFETTAARLGDLGAFIRGQGPAHFDVLASDEQPEVTGQIDAPAFARLHELFRRYYQLILVDSGNNIRASNWLAAARQADLIAITTTIREDTASAALWMADALERDVLGAGALKQRGVALVTDPAPTRDAALRDVVLGTLAERCATAMPLPYDPALASGGPVDHTRLKPATHTAWLYACAAMASVLSTLPEGRSLHVSG
ncbi:MinD/ParA family ATP-binding protein [Streptomyces litchfieldiae]|uniref:Uncharacterized protein n=1 Tax=Streptomyces litchfieldiae TaxID=3075543 RepID=A0ABU2MM63_9ACTN|nr:hypothetical protein [Streptomyces sp. DSM 44938]MDT0342708.1 hypothetical protein [Streptomyces sp. DSM 44938]